MKLPDSNIHTEVFGSQKELTFGVGNVGLIFEILRNKMYKNPILAIVREISCNARDAHREVGKADVPILINLPNGFNSEFRITDYGPGISPERMENIFINYGSSTKREDNIQTGGFGLGAKTPFSYSDTFNIETVYEGYKYVYVAYIDESRAGKIILASKDPTNEPTGTSIVIPVKRKDFEEFKACVISCCEYWEVPPTIKPDGVILPFQQGKCIISGNDWEMIDCGYNYRSANFIIDGIRYDGNSILEANWAYNKLSLAPELVKLGIKSVGINEILRTPIDFYFKVGELSLSASRDSIHFDAETQKALEAKISDVALNIAKHAKDKIEIAKTYIEAVKLKNSIISNFNFKFLTEYLNTITWNGNQLKDYFYSSDFATKGVVISRFNCVNNRTKFTYQYGHTVSISDLDSEKTILLHQKGDKIPPGLLSYLYNDPKYVKINKIIIIKDVYDDYVLECANSNPVVKPENYDFDHNLLKLLNVEPVSDIIIPKASRKSYTKTKVNAGKIQAYNIVNSSNGIYNFSASTLLEVDLNEDGIYIEYDYENKKFISGNYQLNKLIYSDLIALGHLSGHKLVAFTSTRAKKLGEKWISFDDFASKLEEKFLENNSLDYLKKMYYNYHAESYLISINRYSRIFKEIEILGIKNNITKLYELKKECSNFIENNKTMYNLLNSSGKLVIDSNELEKESKNSELYKLYNAVISFYPLLPMIDQYNVSSYTPIIEYIKLIDQKNKSSLSLNNQKEINNVN